MGQEATAYTSLLAVGSNISVANQSYILDGLNTHHAFYRLILLVPPKRYAILHFNVQLVFGHVWLCPAIRRDNVFVDMRSFVDDGQNQWKISFVAASNHVEPPVVNPHRRSV